ncbi:MAG TPA: hypothetical protein VK369_02800 [Segetibacter sp.]|nr:hypothetical protein [Segetibacter sp.]
MGRLLNGSDVFSNQLVKRIDSVTSIAYFNKVVLAYDYKNNRIYEYTSVPGDSVQVDAELLDNARIKGIIYFTTGKKEGVAYHYVDSRLRMVLIAAAEDVEGKRTQNNLFKILLITFCGGRAIAFVGGYFFSKRLLKPIKGIADEVKNISAQNFFRRIHTGQVIDEWYDLSDTLNALLNRFQETSDLQKRFIAHASHELSTPLTTISSQIEVALNAKGQRRITDG